MGPVEFLVLAFPGETIGADVVAPLDSLCHTGGVRVIDSLIVTRRATGAVETAELTDFEHLKSVLTSSDEVNLIGQEDAAEAAGLLEPGTSALLVLVEHLWAAEAAVAFRAAGGRIAASVRIPPEHITEAHRALVDAEG
ncbi:DUF6325 family protein [Streptacidiphilus sp. P02-A3a]|uniref:DUF6325 family protein n=1 Tax=Streptacidiphilus sp. P02-A3a TaxID=2704468 RepID=UPI0015F945F2|nr:DUF6325 family protein [Streptacidiphilus sp. P02-A3a]QMU67825.1 hypothetical protein GXP74_05860 [Streptacidiphilus sp. P02-A3a]